MKITATDDNTASDPDGVMSVSVFMVVEIIEINIEPEYTTDCNNKIVFTDETTTCTFTYSDINENDLVTLTMATSFDFLDSYDDLTLAFTPSVSDIGTKKFVWELEDDNSALDPSGELKTTA